MSGWTKFELETAAWLSRIAYYPSALDQTLELRRRQWTLLANLYDEKTDTHAFFAQNDGLMCQAIVFRGTASLTEWGLNVDALPESALGGTVHSGFWTAYRPVAKTIQDLLANHPMPPAPSNFQATSCMREGAVRLLVTGHSLGAAMATLAALDLSFSLRGPNIGLITFGAPRVGFEDFISLFEERMGRRYVRMVWEDDPVTQVPCSPYKHPGGLLHLDRNGKDIGAIRRGFMLVWNWIKQMANIVFSRVEGKPPPTHDIPFYQTAILRMDANWERPLE